MTENIFTSDAMLALQCFAAISIGVAFAELIMATISKLCEIEGNCGWVGFLRWLSGLGWPRSARRRRCGACPGQRRLDGSGAAHGGLREALRAQREND